MDFKLTRTEIGVVIAMFVVIITLNAWWRVRAMGAGEQRRQQAEMAAKLDAGAD